MQSQSSSNRLVALLSSPWRSRDTSYVLLVLSLIVFAKNFWLDEDAHIPFRSLAQLRAGNGAVWNLGERVQVTTSAAWYWLLAAVNVPLHDVIATAIVVTVLLFVALLALVRRLYGDTPALWFLLGSFLLSKGFFDFTSSGHENILAYTVLLALYGAYRNMRPPDHETTGQQNPETTGPHDCALGLVVRGLVVPSSDPAPPPRGSFT